MSGQLSASKRPALYGFGNVALGLGFHNGEPEHLLLEREGGL